jgi:hypothetical protein
VTQSIASRAGLFAFNPTRPLKEGPDNDNDSNSAGGASRTRSSSSRIAPAAAPAPAPVIETKVAPPSGLQQGDAQKILNSDDSEFGKMFGIDAILAGKPFEQSPASAALETAAAPVDTGAAPTELPTGEDGEVLPAYREDDKGISTARRKVRREGCGRSETTPKRSTRLSHDTTGADPAKDPEGETVTEPVKLATDFTLLDNENQEVEYPAELKVKFTANGKEVELPLDRTIRLAKMGFYNEEKELASKRSSSATSSSSRSLASSIRKPQHSTPT